MKIFKFGGGILKDATNLITLKNILKEFQNEELFVVVSAFDKTTNHLENLISDYYQNRLKFNESLLKIKSFHFSIIHELDFKNTHQVIEDLWQYFDELKKKFEDYSAYPYEILYDQVVSYGEIFSSCIIYHYLKDQQFDSYYLDARKVICTDEYHRSASINEEETRHRLMETLSGGFHRITVTQGFIGSQKNGLVTTLGREGSDYTASVLGAVLKAEKVIIWKDVEGVFNADPKYYPKAVQIKAMNYDDAAELTGLGAKVLHYRTVQPVKVNHIPLEVRKFRLKSCCGTLITDQADKFPDIPVVIHRKNKILFVITPENGLLDGHHDREEILAHCRRLNIEVNYLNQNGKSFYLCMSQPVEPALNLKEVLEKNYRIEMIFGVMMVKIKNGNSAVFEEIKENKKVVHEGFIDQVHYIFY